MTEPAGSSKAAERLQRLTAQIDEAAGALKGARFAEFADLAASIESAESSWAKHGAEIHGDPEAEAACRRLRHSLDRLGALLGHIAGVQQALAGVDPLHAAVYDRGGAGVAAERRLLQEEA